MSRGTRFQPVELDLALPRGHLLEWYEALTKVLESQVSSETDFTVIPQPTKRRSEDIELLATSILRQFRMVMLQSKFKAQSDLHLPHWTEQTL